MQHIFHHNNYNLIDTNDANFKNLPCIVSEIQTFTNLYHKTEVSDMGKLFTRLQHVEGSMQIGSKPVVANFWENQVKDYHH